MNQSPSAPPKPMAVSQIKVFHPLTKTHREVAQVVLPDIADKFWKRDIALIKLTAPLPTDHVMRLVSGDSQPLRTGQGVVWGKGDIVDFSSLANPDYQVPPGQGIDPGPYETGSLRNAQVPINTPELCGDPSKAGELLCAEAPNKQGRSPASCNGDSGGPLTVLSNDPKRMIQVGLVSHSERKDPKVPACGGEPTWYTNLVRWSDWIKQHVPQTQFVKYESNSAPGEPNPPASPPAPPTDQPSTPLGCGNISDPGSPLPSKDSPTLTWSPMRSKDKGSAVSIGVSKLAYPKGGEKSGAIIVGECAWADALAATALMNDGPLLLTDGNRLEDEVLAEIKRLNVNDIAIVGGPKVVAPAVEEALKAAGLTVTRFSGESRVETAANIANQLTKHEPGDQGVILARAYPAPGGSASQAFADSLGAAYASVWLNSPIVLSETQHLSTGNHFLFKEWTPKHIYVMGGHAALTDKVTTDLQSMTKPGLATTRFNGASRADTAKQLANHFLKDGATPLARGVIVIEGFADDAWKAGFTLASLAHQTQSVYALADDGNILPESQALIKDAKQRGLPIRCVASQKTCEKVRGL